MRSRSFATLSLLILTGRGPGASVPLVIQNVTVIPGTGQGLLPDNTVVIEGDRIRAMGPAGTVEVPRAAS